MELRCRTCWNLSYTLEELEVSEKNGFLRDQLAKRAPYLTSGPERQLFEIVHEEVSVALAAGAR